MKRRLPQIAVMLSALLFVATASLCLVTHRHMWAAGLRWPSPRMHSLSSYDGNIYYMTCRDLFVPESAADSVPRISFSYGRASPNELIFFWPGARRTAGFSWELQGSRPWVSVSVWYV